ncbi:MAG: aminotransferase class I/II-fold pyridoxal phosphate-dependent enzyme [Ruminococcus sp.]|uniref:pyridoxal phosphate-dependent aminotransferase n=1 Tax=Ruminococcus sp. TaxID=41978 RepID=UPI0025F719A9|nr:aminotransferase class I/II-fold pyridoxal phosphate-dependent enzyme [Ruminococcus sp.]MCR5600919.1 aminotransferase class I/II-fold pyridoxal phosphate-dependent enzyme [Ruminococcus sp.]
MLNGKHGGNDLAHDIKLDFSANLNPLGMPDSVRRAVIASADVWERYPDHESRELRGKLSKKLEVSAEKIVCGNGADDLIYRAVGALRPRRALVCTPAFSEYGKALAEHGCEVREHHLDAANGFAVTESIIADIEGNNMVFIASPNNPTGTVIGREMLEKIVDACEKYSAYLVCDESFIGFTENACELTATGILSPKVIVLRSFTKLFAMAGLRLGYAVCGSSDTASLISYSGQYWSVSAPAQAAGIAALDENEYVVKNVRYVSAEREFLSSELSECGLEVFPSSANYLLFRGDSKLGEYLLNEGILVRSCADYSGLDDSFFRIAVRTHEENQQLINAVRRIMNG